MIPCFHSISGFNGRNNHKHPQDRDGTFDPQVMHKREKVIEESLADRIIGLYAIGNSTREISDILEE